MATLTAHLLLAIQNQRIASNVKRERSRLRQFIRRFVRDEGDADDILQEVFSELTQAYRLMQPIEQVSAWLYRVARNRITDRFRKLGREVSLPNVAADESDDFVLDRLLPDADAGPEAAFTRQVLVEEIFNALDELPRAQRDAFIAHEFDGMSFKDMSAATGVPVNTLLARKHSAVLYLRRQLRDIFDEYSDNGFGDSGTRS